MTVLLIEPTLERYRSVQRGRKEWNVKEVEASLLLKLRDEMLECLK